ncbi:anthranilate synthase component II [Salirhabdus salicampi]|uniref:anthranilate synthase component II n=1 Tax=Salirhabdus salicampi TaxID=476102 RepID=UPI0020C286FA|nr:aminodeoxychorismate/anthranilate synthase component II [Salirhabdus salicampi]MCP8617979.1 aminodeoxychorismate/anthranilate synthase component II [Salirhabdus salicampi]
MILLIDNYDSFTFNLYQYIGELGADIIVKRNDEITVDEIKTLNPDAIVLSPGPGRPENAGVCIDVIQSLHKTYPILGICLGHQAIGAAFGGNIIEADQIKHGKTSELTHNGQGVFADVEQLAEVMRYHSLIIEKDSLPFEFETTATSSDDNEIMAIQHKEFPVYGLQFHPESIGTDLGKIMLGNFLKTLGKGYHQNENVS